MRHLAKAEDEILAQRVLASQDDTPTESELKAAMKAARRVRRKTRKLATRVYDGLHSESSQSYCYAIRSQLILRALRKSFVLLSTNSSH